jgi:hypothetical protein
MPPQPTALVPVAALDCSMRRTCTARFEPSVPIFAILALEVANRVAALQLRMHSTCLASTESDKMQLDTRHQFPISKIPSQTW